MGKLRYLIRQPEVRAIFGEFKKSRALKSPFKNFRREVRQGRGMTPSFKLCKSLLVSWLILSNIFCWLCSQKSKCGSKKSSQKSADSGSSTSGICGVSQHEGPEKYVAFPKMIETIIITGGLPIQLIAYGWYMAGYQPISWKFWLCFTDSSNSQPSLAWEALRTNEGEGNGQQPGLDILQHPTRLGVREDQICSNMVAKQYPEPVGMV